MDTPLLRQQQYVMDQENGNFVSSKVARLAEMLAAFDETLLLQYVPEQERSGLSGARPFRIIQDAPGHPPYIVMYLSEDQLDYRVIAKLEEARQFGKDGSKSLLQTLQIQEDARRLEQLKIDQEQREEAMDKARFLIKTPLHTVNFEGKRLHL